MKKTRLILFALTMICSLIAAPLQVPAESLRLFGNAEGVLNRISFLNSLNSDVLQSKDAAATTTLVRKHRDKTTLQSWFPYYFANAQITGSPAIKLKGYQVKLFNGYLEGTSRRGVAIDFGEYFLIESSTDMNVSAAELIANAELTYRNSLKAEAVNLKALPGCQCTDYAGDLVPSLPNGLWTINDKKAIINHLFPQGDGGQMSSVAIHDIGTSAGHVSVVKGVAIKLDGNLKVSITERNYTGYCQLSARNDTMEALKIVGYYDPRYAVSSSFPNIIQATNTTGKAGVPFTVNISGSSFDPSSMYAVILGGSYCTTFYSCQIPNSALMNKSSSSVQVPLQLNSPNSYRLYIFNANQGKTSFGQPITITY